MSTSRLVLPVSIAWLAGLTLYVLATGGISSGFAVGLLAGSVMLGILIPPRFTGDVNGVSSFLGFCLLLYLPIVTSAIFNEINDPILVNLALLIVYSVVGWNLSRVPFSSVAARRFSDKAFFSGVALGTAVAFFAAFVLLRSSAYAPEYWGRLSFSAHPNLVGLMALTGLLAAPAIRSRIWRLVLIAGFLLIMNESQSRMAVVAGVLAMGLHLVLAKQWWAGLRRRGWLRLLLPAGLLVGIFAAPTLVQVFLSDVLLIDDAQRGLGSGLSGRDTLWAESLALFAEHPWFGVGYGEHGRILGIPYAHNMAIVLLADTGVFGFVTFTIASGLSALGFIRYMKLSDNVGQRIGLVIIFAYWVYGLGEGRALNVGNTLSILYVIVIFFGLGLLTKTAETSKKGATPYGALFSR